MTLQVCIMTPDRIFWNDQADEIILPTNTGQMGVLTNHAPLITALDIGVTLIRSNSDWIPVALMGGFALVKQNQVTQVQINNLSNEISGTLKDGSEFATTGAVILSDADETLLKEKGVDYDYATPQGNFFTNLIPCSDFTLRFWLPQHFQFGCCNAG